MITIMALWIFFLPAYISCTFLLMGTLDMYLSFIMSEEGQNIVCAGAGVYEVKQNTDKNAKCRLN